MYGERLATHASQILLLSRISTGPSRVCSSCLRRPRYRLTPWINRQMPLVRPQGLRTIEQMPRGGKGHEQINILKSFQEVTPLTR